MDGEDFTGNEDGGGDLIDESQIVDAGAVDKGTARTEIQQQDPGTEIDYMTSPLLEMDGPDGKPIQFTGKEILERFEKIQELEEMVGKTKTLEGEKAELMQKLQSLEASKLQQPQEQQSQQQSTGSQDWQSTIAADVDWKTIGNNFTEMIEGEKGGPDAIGPALRDMIIHVAREVVDKSFPTHYGQIKEQEKVVQTFDTKFSDFRTVTGTNEFRQFTAENPFFNPVEAYLAYKLEHLGSENETIKKSGADAVKAAEEKGKKAGESQTVKQLKAKGNIRLLTGGPGGARPQAARQSKGDLSNEESRQAMMIERLNQMRAGAA